MYKKSQKYLNDYNYGNKNEEALIHVIRSHFNEDILKLDRYNIFDYQGNNKFIELKSRNNEKNKYLSTIYI